MSEKQNAVFSPSVTIGDCEPKPARWELIISGDGPSTGGLRVRNLGEKELSFSVSFGPGDYEWTLRQDETQQSKPTEPLAPARFAAGWTRRGNLEVRYLEAPEPFPEIVCWSPRMTPESAPYCERIASWTRHASGDWELRFVGGQPFRDQINRQDFFALAEVGQCWLEAHRSEG